MKERMDLKLIYRACVWVFIGLVALGQTLKSAEAESQKSGISGPGAPVEGDGSGGWRSGREGVRYQGSQPKPGWITSSQPLTTGSAVKRGLLPPVKPLLELHLRAAMICRGGDGKFYLTGASGDNVWDFNDGVELWRSEDLKNWDYLGLVWSVQRDGTWEKQPRDMDGRMITSVWSPEIHFMKGNYFICLSMAPDGISLLKSATGKPEGPYVKALKPDEPLAAGIDPTLFEDDNGKVYFTYGNPNKLARMKDDLSGLAEQFRRVELVDPDPTPSHHDVKCEPRGMYDLGHEGAVLFKHGGRYYLGAADQYEGRYSLCLAMSENIYGPYSGRHEAVPCGGGGNVFRDKDGHWWCAFFGNDTQSPWREKPGIVPITFNQDGSVRPVLE